MLTITQKDYKYLIRRQDQIERDLNSLKQIVRQGLAQEQIFPSVLKRWERISNKLDRGKGRTFLSTKEMEKWLLMSLLASRSLF